MMLKITSLVALFTHNTLALLNFILQETLGALGVWPVHTLLLRQVILFLEIHFNIGLLNRQKQFKTK